MSISFTSGTVYYSRIVWHDILWYDQLCVHTKKYKSKKRPVAHNPQVAGKGKGQHEHTHKLPVPIPKVLAKWEAPGVSGGVRNGMFLSSDWG